MPRSPAGQTHSSRVCVPLPHGRGFHERATTVKYFLVQRRRKTASPTNGRRHSVLPSSILRKVFCRPRRLALLPFALCVERLALRCQLESLFLVKRVLLSQYRTERLRFQWRPFRRDLAVTRTRRWVQKPYTQTTPLSGLLGRRRRPAVAQRFVHFSAHPQAVQQHRQLPRHRHDRSLLGILAAALGQLQSPTLKIRIRAPPVQN